MDRGVEGEVAAGLVKAVTNVEEVCLPSALLLVRKLVRIECTCAFFWGSYSSRFWERDCVQEASGIGLTRV